MASTTPTPRERLASSRQAIVRHMHHNELSDQDDTEQASGTDRESSAKPDGTWGILKQALGTWWHHHPAHMALDVAKPMLGSYAKTHPAKLLGLAASIGALVVVVKPWRLVSMGGLLIAAIKSSDLSSTLLSMLCTPAKSDPAYDQPDNRTETR